MSSGAASPTTEVVRSGRGLPNTRGAHPSVLATTRGLPELERPASAAIWPPELVLERLP
jgi:hypothetical protein